MHRWRFCLPALIVLLAAATVSAQVEDNLERYSQANGEGYLKPLVQELGVSLNRGWFRSGHVPAFGLSLRIGVVAMTTPVLDEDKTFTATTEGAFKPVQSAQVPTLVGNPQSLKLSGTGGTQYAFPGGLDISSITLGVPQLTIGSLLGTSAVVRYIAVDLEDNDIGDLSLLGFGARHSISQYFPLLPIDLSLGIFLQNLKIGDDLVKLSTLHIGLQASRGFGPLAVYAGIGRDQTQAELNYTYQGGAESSAVSFEFDGDNGLQTTLGAALNLGVLFLNGDMTFGQRQAYSVGLFLGF